MNLLLTLIDSLPLTYFTLLVLFIFYFNLPYTSGNKKNWPEKNIKKMSKSEVDVKSYVLPCSIDEEKYLNSTLGSQHKHLHNCKRKFVIKLTVHSGGECSKSDGFIPIDHVIDGITGRKKRLLNPLMIRMKREKMYQLYDLQLLKSVNGEAKEEVINYENTEKFSGCDTSSSHPTCGFSFFNNKIVQFSEGFCCACDQTKNDQRQPCEGRPGESKNMPEAMQYNIRHHRSNRSSRDLETWDLEPKLNENIPDLEDNIKHNGGLLVDDKLQQHTIQGHEQINGFTWHYTNSKQGNNVKIRQELVNQGDAHLHSNNASVRMYQLEQTVPPENFNDHRYTMANFNILIEAGEVATGNGRNNKYTLSRPADNNSIPGNKLKMLLTNKIKQNKQNEQILTTVSPNLFIAKATSHYEVRSVSNETCENSSEIEQIMPSRKGDKPFALKLVSGDREINIHVGTTMANSRTFNTHSNERNRRTGELAKTHFREGCTQPSSKNNEVQHSTSKGNSSLFRAPNKASNLKYLNSMEKLMFEIVPVINTAQTNVGISNQGIKNLIIKDLENCTQNVTFELKNVNVPASLPNTSSEYCRVNTGSGIRPKSLRIDDSHKSQTSKNDLIKQHLDFQQDLKSVNEPSKVTFGNQKQNIGKREACDKQPRGGQSCLQENKNIPCDANPDTYFESAHCLRFSDLWYNVHRLTNPRMENSITVKIYAKHSSNDKRICWENLTKRLPGRVGTVNEILTDDGRNVVISYSSDDKVAFSLDCASDYLLVPQSISKHCKSSELKAATSGGPGEYLILKESEISFDGDECDRAGVNYAAFARQSHRCKRPAGSCLKNQPLQFWRDDKKAVEAGNQGQYFLSNFLTVTDQAILQNTSSNQVVLRAPYYEHFKSHIVVEVNADHIDIIADRSEGQLTEVYIDATSEKVTIIKAVVTNMGIAADFFGVRFANCTYPLGPSDFDRPGKDEIPPQHRITYTATISTPLMHKKTECQMLVLNVDQDVIAARHIELVRGERCLCVWHCKCVCYDYPHPPVGLPCRPLALSEYNHAGFPGQLPVTVDTYCSSILIVVVQGLLWLLLILLLAGLVKAILGLCFSSVAVWGLWYIYPDEARCLYCYREPHLACYPVVNDSKGFPIHPRTFKRSVHFLPWYSEFSTNVFFFVCLLRLCICNSLPHQVSSVMLPYQYQPMACSPTRRQFRLAAGGEAQLSESNSQNLTNDDPEPSKQLVSELTRAYVVFRNFIRPVGGVKSVPGTPYCIRGYFLESDSGVYQFNPPSPLMQIWQMDSSPMEPPVLLDPTPFCALYRSASEVLVAHELSVRPRGLTINAL